jgi:nicotinamide-nucleotide amidase
MQHQKSKIIPYNGSEVCMKVGMLVIASEILEGKISDLNTQFLGKFLRKHHLELGLTLTVRDIEADIHLALKILTQEVDVVVTSGGLGPTKDDITKMAIATFLDRKLEYSEQANQTASDNYARYGRTYPGKEHGYSYLPKGFTALSNPTGMAPGFSIINQNKFYFSAPGVPKEFQAMTEAHLLPLISPALPKNIILDSLTFRTKRVPEEKIFGEVDPELWDKLEKLGSVSSLPILMGVDIGVKISAATETELKQKREQVHSIMKTSPVWASVWHVGSETLEELIVAVARQKKITFGFAESCTGGLCSHRITNVAGSSAVFMGSVVSYDEAVKVSQLKVNESTLKEFSAVSVQTAEEMAQGLTQELNLGIGVSITGLAGPGGGTKDKPVGTVCIGVSHSGKTEATSYQFFGDREQLKNRFSQAALMALYEALEKIA